MRSLAQEVINPPILVVNGSLLRHTDTVNKPRHTLHHAFPSTAQRPRLIVLETLDPAPLTPCQPHDLSTPSTSSTTRHAFESHSNSCQLPTTNPALCLCTYGSPDPCLSGNVRAGTIGDDDDAPFSRVLQPYDGAQAINIPNAGVRVYTDPDGGGVFVLLDVPPAAAAAAATTNSSTANPRSTSTTSRSWTFRRAQL